MAATTTTESGSGLKMEDSRALDEGFISQVFPNKTEEKRTLWLKTLQDEEFTTIGELRNATDDAWKAVNLPISVKDTLKRFISSSSTTTVEPTTTTTTTIPTPPSVTVEAAAAAATSTTTIPTTPTTGSQTTQIDVICFDVSGSMRGSSFERDKTRAEIGKILFQTMVDKIVGAELKHAIGLLTFGSSLDFTAFTRDCTKFENALGELETSQGSTRLYDAIDSAATHIEKYKKEHSDELDPNCFFRVFCLTDGEDTASGKEHWKVAARLCRHNIVLDAFPLAGSNKWFQAMAAATGGLCLKVEDAAHGIGLFEREAILRLDCRDPPRKQPPTSIRDLENLFESEAARAVSDVQTSVPKTALAPCLCGAYEVALAAKSTAATGSAAIRRAFKELKEVQHNSGSCCVSGVFVSASDFLFWKVLFEGPSGTPYEGCRWMLSVRFPTNYPDSPPQVKFLTQLYHLNVSSDGRICLDILSNNTPGATSWSKSLSIQRVLTAIKALLEHPNSSDPLDTYKAQVYKDDPQRYAREARDHSKQVASLSVDQLKAKFKIDA